MNEIDRRIARFDEVLDRLPGGIGRGVNTRRIQRTLSNGARRARRAVIAAAMLLAGLLVYSLFVGGIGIAGFLLAALLVPLCMIIAASAPLGGGVAPAELRKAAPAVLPARASVWLDQHRPDLPRLAAPTLDSISAKLNAIGPQLATIPAMDPMAQDIGRLLNTHLPELVERYTKVPEALRRAPGDDGGPSIEARLVEGLKTVDAELGRVSGSLAAGDRDAFLIQGKFLENKYKDGGVG